MSQWMDQLSHWIQSREETSDSIDLIDDLAGEISKETHSLEQTSEHLHSVFSMILDKANHDHS